MRLCLKSDADVLDWGRENCVANTSKGAGKIVLSIGERCWTTRVLVQISLFQRPPRKLKATKLNRYTGSDSDQRCQRAFVEGKSSFFFVDLYQVSLDTSNLAMGLSSDLTSILPYNKRLASSMSPDNFKVEKELQGRHIPELHNLAHSCIVMLSVIAL